MKSGTLFLGVDGGQSHTEAIVADESGSVIGRGIGGPSVSTDFAGGEQLERAVREALTAALGKTVIPGFHSAHFGLTGELHDEKRVRLESFVKAERLSVGHDAPSALIGASNGRPGIIVISGTGSVVYGENESGGSARAGGLGYMFSDEGSGFWIGAQTVRYAILENDRIIPDSGIRNLVCEHFGCSTVIEVASGFYKGDITRDKVAAIARAVQRLVGAGRFPILRDELKKGAELLVEKVKAVGERLGFEGGAVVYGAGGMFKGEVFRDIFSRHVNKALPGYEFTAPRFGPAEGALLLAFRNAGLEINEVLLENLQESIR